MKKKFLIFLLLLIISAPTIRDLLKPGAYTSHDITHHIVRLIHMDRIIREGQLPARWTGDLNMGYGYPLFLFNYPLPQYLGVAFHLLGANFVWSVKLVFIFSLIASIFSAYLFFEKLWGKKAGIVASIYYLYAPIRFINVYVSATIGNALAFVFAPLPFYSATALTREKSRRAIFWGALGIAGLMLSHNIMALMFLPVFAAYVMAIYLKSKEKKFIFCILLTLFFGLGLSAFFWLPATVEKKYIRYDQILPGFYRSHFPTIRQLLYSPWGYGFSWPGDNNDNPGRMSNQIGLAHLAVIAFTIFTARRGKLPWQIIFFTGTFFASFLLMLKESDPLWKIIPWMQYIQMPWRLLALSIFCASVCAGFLAWKFKSLIVSVSLILFVLYANRNLLRINQIFDPGEQYFKNILNTTTMAGEHLPSWAMQRDKPSPAKVEIVNGLGSLSFYKAVSGHLDFEAHIASRATILVNQYYFPDWKVVVNGQPKAFSYANELEGVNGLIHFELPQGVYRVKVIFAKTTVRVLADTITVLTFAYFVVYLFRPWPKWIK